MKIKKILILLLSIFTFSCSDPGGDPIFQGFQINSFNGTNNILNGELVIGGCIKGNFIPTDSIKLSNIKTGRSHPLSNFFDENRWKPNLDKIRSLPSDRCCFKLKLSDGREELLTEFESSDLLSLLLPNETNFKGSFGLLFISADKDEIWADVGAKL